MGITESDDKDTVAFLDYRERALRSPRSVAGRPDGGTEIPNGDEATPGSANEACT